MEKYLKIFREQYPFTLLSNKEFEKMFQGASIRDYQKNEFIIHQDQQSDDVEIHFLLSGLGKNIMHRTNGKQIDVRFYYPGDLIGIMIMLTSGEMKFSVEALEQSRTLCFHKQNFLEIMSNNNKFSKVVLESISNLMKCLYHEITSNTSDRVQNEKDLYKQRVDKYMEPPFFVQPDQTINDAAEMLKVKQVSALFVSKDNTKLAGVIDYKEILDALIRKQGEDKISKYMNENPFTVHHQDFIYNALSYLKQYPTAIIPVQHKHQIVGYLQQASFFKLNDSIYFDLRHKISISNTITELKFLSPSYNDAFQSFVQSLLDDGMLAFEITELISSYNDRLHQQIVKIAEQEMINEGYGAPPINYCFIVMGSEGRGEQGFSTDQDNGMILSDYHHLDNQVEIENYFKLFTQKINNMLVECGFPLCSGGIMAKEDKWRKSLSLWQKEVDQWIERMDAEEIRDFTIFIDFRPIYGDYSLAYQLRDVLTNKMKRSLNLHQLLMKDTLRFRVPIQPFGIIQTGKNRTFNLKKSAIMQIVNAVRIYSIKNGIEEINTTKRLDALSSSERFHPRDSENAKLAMHRLLSYRLKENLKQLQEGKALNNELSLTSLSKDERKILREALSIAKRLQQVLELSYNRNRVV